MVRKQATGSGNIRLRQCRSKWPIMTHASLKFGTIAAAIIAGLAIWLSVERHSYNTLQDENALLRQRIDQLSETQPQTEVALSQEGEETKPRHHDDSELLKLRREVGALRNLVEKTKADLATAESDNAQMLAVSNALLKAAWGNTTSNLMLLKYVGLAAHLFAAENGGSLPTNMSQISGDSTIQFPPGVGPEAFEFFDYGQPLATNMPGYYFLAREARATLYPSGQWKQVYLLADGSVQIGTSDDGNFDSWEQQWIEQQAQIPGQPSSQ